MQKAAGVFCVSIVAAVGWMTATFETTAAADQKWADHSQQLVCRTVAQARIKIAKLKSYIKHANPAPGDKAQAEDEIEALQEEIDILDPKRCQDCPVGHPNSTHKAGLAVDIILYGPGGQYPHPSEDSVHSDLHDFWDFIGGAERIPGDLNHYSLEWQGVR